MSEERYRPGDARAPWKRPDRAELERYRRLLAPWEWFTNPMVVGLDHIPKRGPALLVGNHTVLGLYDAPILFLKLNQLCDIVPRALGHHMHFRIPGWRDLLLRFGTVDGTPANCAQLMRDRQYVLVFPGGAREVAKRKGEHYQLFWKERMGFARLAIEHGCPIVPFASVGAEDAFDVVVDADDLLRSPLGVVLRAMRVKPDEIIPIVRGIGPTMIPRPERLYFKFMRPISTRAIRGRQDDEALCREVRDRTRRAVENGIKALRRIQATDPERSRLRAPWVKETKRS